MRKDRVRRDREDLEREYETVSSVIKIVLHKQEDDLKFLFREFLLLSRVNNMNLSRRLPSQIFVVMSC